MALDLNTAIRKRRMYREFEDRPVSREDAAALVWAAGRAQQARPGTRHLIVVDDPGLMKTARTVLAGLTRMKVPMMLVLCSDISNPSVDCAAGRDRSTWMDAGAACAHIALAAQDLGLGVCTIAGWTQSAVRALFEIPDHLRPDVTVVVGYPLTTQNMRPVSGAKYRPAVHYNEFGIPFEQEA
ncbi:MAG TPA: nitroreductase family protein [Jatrophihabitans sp.]|jgi:nitroreductase